MAGTRTGRVVDGTKKVFATGSTIAFNNDATAIEALEVGRYHQVQVYASKDDEKQPSGYTLISSTETLRGVFRVVDNP